MIVNDTYLNLSNSEYAEFPQDLLSEIEKSVSSQKGEKNAASIVDYNNQFYIIAVSEITDSLRTKQENGTNDYRPND